MTTRLTVRTARSAGEAPPNLNLRLHRTRRTHRLIGDLIRCAAPVNPFVIQEGSRSVVDMVDRAVCVTLNRSNDRRYHSRRS